MIIAVNNLEVKAALKVEEVVVCSDGTMYVTKMWQVLDKGFLPIDQRESIYKHFVSRCMRHGEIMTEYPR